MAVTIKYKDLTKRLTRQMSINQLVIVRDEILQECIALTDEDWETRRARDELMAQVKVITTVIDEKSRFTQHKCEKCGNLSPFSLNMCEDCFDNEVDRYYDGGRDEDE